MALSLFVFITIIAITINHASVAGKSVNKRALPRSGFDSPQKQKCLLMVSLVVNDMPVRLQHTIAQILKPFVSEIGCRHGDYFIQTVSSSDGSFLS